MEFYAPSIFLISPVATMAVVRRCFIDALRGFFYKI